MKANRWFRFEGVLEVPIWVLWTVATLITIAVVASTISAA